MSDFINTNHEKSIKIIKKRHDIIGIKVNDKTEKKVLPNIGIIPLKNSESEKYFF